MLYRVTLHRSSIADAAIELEARDEAEAREIAEQRARDGMVCWTACGDEVESSAEPVEVYDAPHGASHVDEIIADHIAENLREQNPLTVELPAVIGGKNVAT